MSDIASLVRDAQNNVKYTVLPTSGLPTLPEPFVIPKELVQFYDMCGGIRVAENVAYGLTIVEPRNFISADKAILEHVSDKSRTAGWFVIATDYEGQYVSINCSGDQHGWCYDSYWDRHGNPGDSQVIAHSFAEFLEALIQSATDYWFWLKPDYPQYGDAFV